MKHNNFNDNIFSRSAYFQAWTKSFQSDRKITNETKKYMIKKLYNFDSINEISESQFHFFFLRWLKIYIKFDLFLFSFIKEIMTERPHLNGNQIYKKEQFTTRNLNLYNVCACKIIWKLYKLLLSVIIKY